MWLSSWDPGAVHVHPYPPALWYLTCQQLNRLDYHSYDSCTIFLPCSFGLFPYLSFFVDMYLHLVATLCLVVTTVII